LLSKGSAVLIEKASVYYQALFPLTVRGTRFFTEVFDLFLTFEIHVVLELVRHVVLVNVGHIIYRFPAKYDFMSIAKFAFDLIL